MNKNNKFRASSKYFTIAGYTVITALIICLIIKIVFFWDSASTFLNNLVGALAPFLIGILIAFLMNPLVHWMKRVPFGKWIKIKNKGVQTGVSIAVSYVIVIAAFSIIILFIIPSIYQTILDLAKQIEPLKHTIVEYANFLDGKFDLGLADKINENLTAASISKYFQQYASDISQIVVSTSVGIATAFFNVGIAFVVSFYLLLDLNIQARSFKRFVYAFMEKERAAKLCKVVKRAIHIFSNFFDSKMLESLVVGLICFVGTMIMGICGLPGFYTNALLISVIVGLTTMIPYFGPYIAWVPCALLLLAYSWQGALVFTIFLIVLMNVDGSFISPKIVGNSLGLRPLWVIFAITIGGWAYGFVGMLIGVPVVATISGLLKDSVDKKLKKKDINLPTLQPEKKKKEK